MPTVTVELEDLEKLVFGTGVIKTVESALNAYQDDPFVPPQNELTNAHNRLAKAVREAKRSGSGTLIDWDEPLTEKEVSHLSGLRKWEVERGDFLRVAPTHKTELDKTSFDSLAAKGCVSVGQLIVGEKWGDEDKPRLRIDPSCFVIKSTARGRSKLDEYNRSRANAPGS